MLQANKEVLGKQVVKNLKEILLPSNTFKCRIEKISENIENQVIIMVKHSSFYSNQLDESTDISNK